MRRLLLTTSFLFILSCNKTAENHQEIENLQNRISILEEENKKLQDSLSKSEKDFLWRQLIGIPESRKQKVGKKNNIVMLLHEFDKKLPKYEIFRIIDGKEIKVGENDGTRFDYEFIPTSTKDNSPKFLIKMRHKGKIIEIPGELRLEVEK
ncbi:hypothetical protein IVB69_02360 [Flavobacterium sp. J49]|nr:hypothetical protein [Flavobacterium sp. J49]NIC01560.1 hypothetical protein [Flavobacterium sp. J49]